MIWTEVLAIGQFVVLIASIVGGYFGVRAALAKSTVDVQERVRAALSAENDLLTKKVDRQDREMERQDREMARLRALVQLLIETFKKHRNIDVEMQSDRIIIRDGAQTLIAQLPESHDGASA